MVAHGYAYGPLNAYGQKGGLDYLWGRQMADGGGYVTHGPVEHIDMNTGERLAISGEGGAPEVDVTVPTDKPAQDTLAAQVQQLPAFQQYKSRMLSGMNTGNASASTTQMGGPPTASMQTAPKLIRAAAKAMRPPVKLGI